MTDLPRGTVTLLFTDIEGSTRLLLELGVRYPEVLKDHRRVLRSVFAARNGVEVDTQGDAFFVAFERASDAVAAARAAQQALAVSPVKVRMGIHTGEPVLIDEGYVGIDVHRAARICAAGHGGQVLLSQATRQRIDPSTELRDLGEHRLKDLNEPEWLFQLLGTDLQSSFPPLRSLSNTNLPTEMNALVGRGRERTEINALLADQNVRLLTLTGPGGTGKTQLALRVAADLVEHYSNGVFLVTLASVTDPTRVVSAVAQTLGVRETATQTVAEGLRRHLEAKHLLLVLDNFEQVISAASDVASLLASTRHLTVLVTSRERLRVVGEHEYAVPPLSEDEAVALFAERARAIEPSVRIEDDRAAVAAICRRLDCLPLAVELAASRVKLMSPEALLGRLEQRLPILSSGPRDAPTRQQTLRATIDWSYELLSRDERRHFACLAIFVAGWTLEAAEVVCGCDVDQISSLLDKSLVRRAEDRYLMLETIREYALERLEASKEAGTLRHRHAEYMSALVSPLALRARRSERGAIAQLDAEYGNARSALDWALSHEEQPLFESLVEGLSHYWLFRGRTGEGYRYALAALERASIPSPYLLLMAGELALYSGDLDRAVEFKRRSVAAYEASEPGSQNLAVALTDLAETLIQRGELDRAEEPARRALAIQMVSNRPFAVAHARAPLRRLELQRGNFRGAAEMAEASIPLWEQAQAWSDLAWEYLGAAAAYRGTGQITEARARLQSGLRYASESGDLAALAGGLEQAAALAAHSGRLEIALRLLGAAREWRRSSGDVAWRDEAAWRMSHGRVEDRQAALLVSEGALWELDEAVRHAVESLSS